MVLSASVGLTHRISIAPESRRTDGAWCEEHCSLTATAVYFYPAHLWRQHFCHSVLLHMASLCHGIRPSSGPHRSASTFHLMANWFRDKEALWCSTRPLLSFLSRPPVAATLLPQRTAAYGKPVSRQSVIFIPPM